MNVDQALIGVVHVVMVGIGVGLWLWHKKTREKNRIKLEQYESEQVSLVVFFVGRLRDGTVADLELLRSDAVMLDGLSSGLVVAQQRS